MALDKDTVAHIASLARIEVPEAELEAMAAELGQIITWVEQLAEVDTEGVEPMSSVVWSSLKKRADVVTDGSYAERIVANAPERFGHYFTVPKVIE
jgi:aspartyl-tRNA(Asn)/glutamyl-tRNA(Gln) amidotransferase subunit C